MPWHTGHHSPRSKLLWSAQDELTEALTLLQQLRDDNEKQVKEKQVEENKRLAKENASLNQNNLQLRDEKEVILNQNNQLRLRNQSLMNQLNSEQSFQRGLFQHIQSLQDEIAQLRQDLRQDLGQDAAEAAENRQEIGRIGLRPLSRAVPGLCSAIGWVSPGMLTYFNSLVPTLMSRHQFANVLQHLCMFFGMSPSHLFLVLSVLVSCATEPCRPLIPSAREQQF